MRHLWSPHRPNLTVTPVLWTQEGFDQVVLLGGRADKGMGNFGKDLKPEDTVAICEYLVSRANLWSKRTVPGAGGPPAPARKSGTRTSQAETQDGYKAGLRRINPPAVPSSPRR